MAANDKYSLVNMDNLTQPIQMKSSKKQKSFFEFFSAFLKSRSNFEDFEKNNDQHTLCISQIIDSERRV